MSPLIPTLTTARLTLRPYTQDDAPAVHALVSDRAVSSTMLSIPHPYPDGLAARWIGTHRALADTGMMITWAITLAEAPHAAIGSISLGLAPAHRRAELGYWLGVPYWNQGYATEAARRVTAFAFDERDLIRVQATCFPRNPASARVMRKIGMRYEGLLRAYFIKDGVAEDVEMYAVLRQEFER